MTKNGGILMALKSIDDKDLVDGSLIKHYCEKCNKNVVMKILYGKEGMLGECCSCKRFVVLKKNENYIPETPVKHIPKCPTCQSTDIQKIGTGERVASVAMLGIFSKKINKSFKCKNCGYMW